VIRAGSRLCAGRGAALVFLLVNLSWAAGDSMFLINGLAADPLLESGGSGRTARVFSAGLPGLKYDRPPHPPGLRLRNPFGRAFGPGTGGPPRDQTELGARIQRAERFINRGDWDRARLEIEQALENYPDNPYLLRRAAALAALAGKYVAADEYFRRYHAIDPDDVTYNTGWADVLIRLNRYEEAWALINRALQQDPSYLPARFDHTLLCILRDDFQGIEKEWENVPVESLPELCHLIDLQRPEIEPLIGESRFRLLADAVLGSGTLDHSDRIAALAAQATEQLRAGDWEAAEKSLAELGRYGLRTYVVHVRRSFCLFQQGRHRQAAAILARLCQRHPEDPSLWYNLGFVLAKMEAYDKAETIFRKALELQPENDDARFALACVIAGQGRMAEAFGILEELAQRRPERMPRWLEGDAPYLAAIRSDSRFADLKQKIAEALHRRVLMP